MTEAQIYICERVFKTNRLGTYNQQQSLQGIGPRGFTGCALSEDELLPDSHLIFLSEK